MHESNFWSTNFVFKYYFLHLCLVFLLLDIFLEYLPHIKDFKRESYVFCIFEIELTTLYYLQNNGTQQ